MSDHRFGWDRAGSEISGRDVKCRVCLQVSERAGVDVLRGMKLCFPIEPDFGGKRFGVVSSRRRSKLLVDCADLRDDNAHDRDGLTGEEDARLLSLALVTPGKKQKAKKQIAYKNASVANVAEYCIRHSINRNEVPRCHATCGGASLKCLKADTTADTSWSHSFVLIIDSVYSVISKVRRGLA